MKWFARAEDMVRSEVWQTNANGTWGGHGYEYDFQEKW